MVVDVPLLLETGIAADAVVVATAPAEIQRARVLARPGMTEDKFNALLARQMSDAEKRAKAHYLVITDKGLDHAREQVKMILADVRSKTAMREIVFDTETTGFEPGDGHRIVEVGCVELMDHFPTGRTLQFYLNPERDVPIETTRVHGLTTDFLADKPLFAHVVEEFLEFLGDAPLVIHNASFDIKFINAELKRVRQAAHSAVARHRHHRDRQAQASRRALFAGRTVPALRASTCLRAPSMARCWTPS